MIQTKTTSITKNWSQRLRIKVGSSVSHNNKLWINKTGINSEPSIGSSDWELVFERSAQGRPIVTVFGNDFVLVKHPLNNNPTNSSIIQNDDFIIEGFRSDTEYWRKAICLDETNINVNESWDIVDTIGEDEPEVEIGGVLIPTEGIPVVGDADGTLLQDGMVYDSNNVIIGEIEDTGFGLQFITLAGHIGSVFVQSSSIQVFFGS